MQTTRLFRVHDLFFPGWFGVGFVQSGNHHDIHVRIGQPCLNTDQLLVFFWTQDTWTQIHRTGNENFCSTEHRGFYRNGAAIAGT